MSEYGAVPFALMIVIIIYIMIGEYFKSIHFHLIHETSFGIIIGMLMGLLLKWMDENAYAQFFSLNATIFFYLLLPLIIFSGGYNLKKKQFLKNFKYIVSFGFLSTLLNFIITLTLTIGFNSWNLVRLGTNLDSNISLSYDQMIKYSATICATDSVAALNLIPSSQYPKLFSVVFGEGMVNDAVSIIIFQAVTILQQSGKSFEWYTPFEFIGRFLENCIISILIGLFVGLFSTWCFKKCRFLTNSTTTETVFAFLMAYMGYSICEMLDLSGVISLLMIGIIMSHYQGYNISQLGRVTTRVTFESLSLGAEAFLYVFLGFAMWNQTTYYSPLTKDLYYVEVSWVFTLLQLGIVILARYLSIYIVYWISISIQGEKVWKLTKYEMSICCFAGMVRGSVAFALIETLVASPTDGIEINQINILQSCVLYIVIITTIIFGTTMPFFINFQIAKQLDEEEQKSISEVPTPVLIDQQKKKELSEAQKIIKYMDEHYFKRWFIHDYENRKDKINQEKKQIKTETLQQIYEKAFSETSEDESVKQRNEDFIQLPNFEDKSPTSPLAIKMQELSQQI
ncbi:unnamed protein product [Paramecium primaurelia]|uniref:Cation/H+ exchanger transmembrane domain-containing protein n=1 Tax=Paramecium primaurelia TaxID=5886 RepID=A0A8S1KSW7_PARPR|nr:unnamed protein product [Paramecium primaurelia]